MINNNLIFCVCGLHTICVCKDHNGGWGGQQVIKGTVHGWSHEAFLAAIFTSMIHFGYFFDNMLKMGASSKYWSCRWGYPVHSHYNGQKWPFWLFLQFGDRFDLHHAPGSKCTRRSYLYESLRYYVHLYLDFDGEKSKHGLLGYLQSKYLFPKYHLYSIGPFWVVKHIKGGSDYKKSDP